MRERTRNVLVGLTVLLALGILGALIIIFQELPGFMQPGYAVKVRFPTAGGLVKGSDVMLAGQRVGQVTDVAFTDGDPRKGATVTVIIDREVNIPGTVNAYVRSRGFTGGALVELAMDGKPPGVGRGIEWLPKDGTVTIEGFLPTDGGLISADLQASAADAMKKVGRLADGLNELLGPAPPTATAPSTGPAAPPAIGPATQPSLRGSLARLDAALDGIAAITGDPENQANLKAALANFKNASAAATDAMKEMRELVAKAKTLADGVTATTGDISSVAKDVSAAARSAGQRVERLGDRLVVSAEKLDKALTAIEVAAVKVGSGEGTAGKLLNDPELYNTLTDTAGELKSLMRSLNDLIAQWKESGVQIKVK